MRELITSNDWKLKKNKKYLAIGQWCFFKSNYSLDKNIKIFSSSLFNFKNSQKLVNENNILYEKYLSFLARELNNLHGVKWKKKSWRILIGPWLLKFISVINNRIYLVNDLKKKEQNFYFNPDINENSLISHNMTDYSDKILTKEYNNIIFDRIINGFENIKIFQNKDQKNLK